MHGFALETGIIDANGQLPGVRVQGGHVCFCTMAKVSCTVTLQCTYKQFLMFAYVAEEWNTIAEGGPDFYPSHLPMALLEPQPSMASMQQG